VAYGKEGSRESEETLMADREDIARLVKEQNSIDFASEDFG
jgi:hypothetical protein